MIVEVERKFAVEVVYNGVAKSLSVDADEKVAVLLQKAIAAFHITQQPHLLSLFRQDGTVVSENETVERAGLKPGEVLLLRPNAVKGGAIRLRLAAGVLQSTFRTFRGCGRAKRECVVFWTGVASGDAVDEVAHPAHVSSPFGYTVDESWLSRFWISLYQEGRSIKAQVHTHPSVAFHSDIDDRWSVVSQVGFLSIVVPDFAAGEPSLNRAWVGRLQSDGSWREEKSIEVIIT